MQKIVIYFYNIDNLDNNDHIGKFYLKIDNIESIFFKIGNLDNIVNLDFKYIKIDNLAFKIDISDNNTDI